MVGYKIFEFGLAKVRTNPSLVKSNWQHQEVGLFKNPALCLVQPNSSLQRQHLCLRRSSRMSLVSSNKKSSFRIISTPQVKMLVQYRLGTTRNVLTGKLEVPQEDRLHFWIKLLSRDSTDLAASRPHTHDVSHHLHTYSIDQSFNQCYKISQQPSQTLYIEQAAVGRFLATIASAYQSQSPPMSRTAGTSQATAPPH